MGRIEEDVTMFEMEKAGFSFRIIARLRERQNILYIIQVQKGGEPPIEIYPKLDEMEELSRRFAELSRIARDAIILDRKTIEVIKTIFKNKSS
ncbi:MAG: hypothetical protein QW356_08550 [Candidatus Hadarchaeales archaeon]